MINKTQFQIMTDIEKDSGRRTQRELAKHIGLSLGTVNKAINTLTETGYLKDGLLTPEGYQALEPYRVKRAIFLAAGFGSRLVPITLNTPKPLVMVNGKRMIETLLDAVVLAEIPEIIIITGYLSEQFEILLKRYPNIRFIYNPIYNEANNISSAYVARDKLENAYVFEADLVLSKTDLITKYQYNSNYLGVPVEKTDDWCFKVTNGRISKLSIGGTNCFHMFGISHWTKEDGNKLAKDIESVYEMPGGKERFWDQVALEFYAEHYNVEVRTCSFDDIVEIDTFNDLKTIDKIYRC